MSTRAMELRENGPARHPVPRAAGSVSWTGSREARSVRRTTGDVDSFGRDLDWVRAAGRRGPFVDALHREAVPHGRVQVRKAWRREWDSRGRLQETPMNSAVSS